MVDFRATPVLSAARIGSTMEYRSLASESGSIAFTISTDSPVSKKSKIL
jgi:hypothetical protein